MRAANTARASVTLVVLAMTAGAVGCRGIIGYEDLVVDNRQGPSADGGSFDSSVNDAGVGGSGDAAAGGDGGGVVDDAGGTLDDAGNQDSGTVTADAGIGGGDAGPPPNDCSQLTTTAACVSCCRTSNPNSFQAVMQATQGNCFCAQKGCDSDCSSYCPVPGSQPTGQCSNCIATQLRNACQSELANCTSGTACYAAATCVESCP